MNDNRKSTINDGSNDASERATMTHTNEIDHRFDRKLTSGLAALAVLTLAGCGPTFDPASLITTTRVLGAVVEVGAESPTRATPMPGESATLTWLIESPAATPPLAWAFALCAPGATSRLSCGSTPFAVFQGTEDPPRMTITVPAATELGSATSLLLYGRVCTSSAPTFDPVSGLPGCTDGGKGTTATATIPVGSATVANHNPTADRGFTFDGVAWPALADGADPCAVGLRVTAGTQKHLIGVTTAGADRESYTTIYGDPPVETAKRESLQISQFATAGEFKSAYAFVESTVEGDAPVAEAKWDAPKVKDVSGDTAVLFTFVLHDGRGGTDWTKRAACVGVAP